MIRRFQIVAPGLYRGSAPSPSDVIALHEKLGVNKIVSLDKDMAKRIDRITKILGIKHVIMPINSNEVEPMVDLFSHDLFELLIDGGPTYVHCIEGKDRTGMVIAMFRCKYMGFSYKEALDEAKAIGFGIGLPDKVKKFYEKAIKFYCKSGTKDENGTDDIVSNTRQPYTDWRGSVLDEADMKSFSPFLDYTRQYPYNSTFNYQYDQYPTRDNYDRKCVREHDEPKNTAPWVGLFDNNSGVRGIGPVELGGGFSQV